MYQQASQEQGQPEGGAEAGSTAGAPEDDVVDADFEEVKEEDKK